jgi:sulfite exporter TauE/SafE
MDTIDIVAILQLGFLGSLGHCIGMCGGFIVTYTSSKIDPQQAKLTQSLYHLLYNSGRISSYVLLGTLFGAFGALWEATPLMRGSLFGFAGVLMIIMGLSLAGKLKFLNNIEYGLTEKAWYKRLFVKLITAQNKRSFYFLGMLNGFFPCGLVYVALVFAMNAGSALGGALVMLLFGLSTVPALFGFGFFVGMLKQLNFRNVMIQLAAITVIFYGGWTLYKSYTNFDRHFNQPAIEDQSDMNKTNMMHSCH